MTYTLPQVTIRRPDVSAWEMPDGIHPQGPDELVDAAFAVFTDNALALGQHRAAYQARVRHGLPHALEAEAQKALVDAGHAVTLAFHSGDIERIRAAQRERLAAQQEYDAMHWRPPGYSMFPAESRALADAVAARRRLVAWWAVLMLGANYVSQRDIDAGFGRAAAWVQVEQEQVDKAVLALESLHSTDQHRALANKVVADHADFMAQVRALAGMTDVEVSQ